MNFLKKLLSPSITELRNEAHKTAKRNGFHQNEMDELHLIRALALVHGEVSEAIEEIRKNGVTKDLTKELADVIIRVLDISGALGIDIEEALVSKMEENTKRSFLHDKRF